MSRSTTPHPTLSSYYREGDRDRFLAALFDGAARHYDRVCGVMSLGTGRRYRRQALERAGLRPGMQLLDVATGTALVARAALDLLGESRAVIGLDPSRGMLEQARLVFGGPLVQGRVEALPFAAGRFDLVSMGYALRHVAVLEVGFRECLRVLKPGGRLLVLEISRPPSASVRWLLQAYLQRVLPLAMRASTGSAEAGLLTRYYWDTIESCVPPDTILEVMRESGFVRVDRRVFGGVLSEYLAARPAAAGSDLP
jgi:demethylmenaquinone methyltransferase / 2-methoxy-6-polyprenyl-1,4-benzoquinol methylase